MAFCKMCGAEIGEEEKFCSACGAENTVGEVNDAAQTVENQFLDGTDTQTVVKKKKTKTPVIIIAVVAIIAAVIGVLFATGTFDKLLMQAGVIKSPAKEIFDAARKTVFESQSLTVESSDGYGEDFVQISFGKGAEEFKMYAETDGVGYYGVYDGTVYEYQGGTSSVSDNFIGVIGAYGENLNVDGADDMANNLFDNKLNEKAVKDIFNVGLRDGLENYMKLLYLSGLDSAEMSKYVDQTTGEIDYDAIPVTFDIPDYDAVMNTIGDFLQNGLTEDAITFEKDGDSYKFEVDVAELLDCLAGFMKENETMKKLIETCYGINDIVDELEGDTGEDIDIYEELEALEEDYREENFKLEGKATIEDGYLTYFEITDGESEPWTITVSSIGSTTVDKAKVEAIDTEIPYEEDYGYYDDYYYDYY